jgi:cytochrome P450
MEPISSSSAPERTADEPALREHQMPRAAGSDVEPRRRAPGPRNPLSGLRFLRLETSLSYLCETFKRYGDVVRYRLGPFPVFLIAHPDGIRHVLQDRHANYLKSQDYVLLKQLLGDGLVTSEGALWLRQRRLIQPIFHRQRVAEFGSIMSEATLEMLESWEDLATEGRAFDVATEMARLALRIVGRVLLSVDLSNEADAVGHALKAANERFGHFDLGMLMPWLPTQRNRIAHEAARTLRRLVDEIIAERRRENRDHGDLLSMLLAARDENGEAMDDRQVRDEVLTLILAGHETTAMALSWTWYLLSQHPHIEHRLEGELREVLGERSPTVADLKNLSYTGMVIDESMRLYPPVWAIGRSPIEDDEIGGYRIPKRSMIVLSQYVTHRHPDFWDEPERFEPERFSAEKAQGRLRYAYFPFAGGPRQCVGNMFALTEANLVLATVAQRYRMHLVPNHPVELQPLVTLRPRYGIKMTLERRRTPEA